MKTLLFDTETTGLVKNRLVPLARQPKIVELFGLSLEDEIESVEINQLFNPGYALDKDVTRITNITDEMLSSAPAFSEKAETIKNSIERHDEVVAHNLSFDKTMVDLEMERAGLKIKWPRLICTVEATEHLKGYRLNLNALHHFLFGEEFTGAHRAENDVRAMAKCFVELRKREIV